MKILFIGSNKMNDFMQDCLFYSLKEIFLNDVIDYPPLWFMYKDSKDLQENNPNFFWGKGFTLYKEFNGFFQVERNNILEKINDGYFNLIIYASIRRNNLFLNEILNIKKKIKLIFIDGEDDQLIHPFFLFNKEFFFFKRELLKKIENSNIFPINFCVPNKKILNSKIDKREFLLAPLIPGDIKTYTYNSEQDYYNMYQKSFFALTFKKAGWDCLRHYEIMMNGCIPLFPDLEFCPSETCTFLPKEKLVEIYKNYKNILDKNINLDSFLKINNEAINQISRDILAYTKEKCSTKYLANYFLDIVLN